MDSDRQIDTVSSVQTGPCYRLTELVLYALTLGTVGFGGPVALVGYMHRDLVERRKWITEAEYKEGLTLAQLMPGPLAAQLAIYLGYVHYGVLGSTLVGVAFVLPSFLMVLAIGWAYLEYGGIQWMQAVFYGVGASVIGIITISAYKLTRKTLGGDWLLWAIYLLSAATTIVTENENVLLFLSAGLVIWFVRSPPWPRNHPSSTACLLLPIADLTAPSKPWLDEPLLQIAWFFTKAGAFVFGSGLAIVPFLYGGVVHEYGWLNDQEFLDAVAVAMITPGPVVITVGFIGFLAMGREAGPWMGLAGASVAALATFLPCYLFTILPAPYFKKHGKRPGIVAFVDGVTAAAIGAIAGACVVLGRRTILDSAGAPDWPKVALLLITMAILMRFKKLPEPFVVLAAAIAGLLLYPFARG
ncbi:chromate transporter [Aeoliella sp. SH292]|uniref:chromate transporter n=1 Tax=Aeoliella sp. SH292 TaxID=3454464 RepID=UPI003F95FC9E